jgi:hypothetical protein
VTFWPPGIAGNKRTIRNRTSQEQGLAPALPIASISGGKPLFLTCSI